MQETSVNVSHIHRNPGRAVLEVASYLGVREETIRRWAREGTIPAAKLGNRGGFRFRREDLDRFLDARRAEGTSLG